MTPPPSDAVRILFELRDSGYCRDKVDEVIGLLASERGAVVPPFLVGGTRDKGERWWSHFVECEDSIDTRRLAEHSVAIASRVSHIAEHLRLAGSLGEPIEQSTMIGMAETLVETAERMYTIQWALGRWGDWADEQRRRRKTAGPGSGGKSTAGKAVRR